VAAAAGRLYCALCQLALPLGLYGALLVSPVLSVAGCLSAQASCHNAVGHSALQEVWRTLQDQVQDSELDAQVLQIYLVGLDLDNSLAVQRWKVQGCLSAGRLLAQQGPRHSERSITCLPLYCRAVPPSTAWCLPPPGAS